MRNVRRAISKGAVMVAIVAAVTMAAAGDYGTASAHSGGTDKDGCHAGSKPYHCHKPKRPSIPVTPVPIQVPTPVPTPVPIQVPTPVPTPVPIQAEAEVRYEGDRVCADHPAWPNGTTLSDMHPYHFEFYTGLSVFEGDVQAACERWANDQLASALQGVILFMRQVGYTVIPPA